MRLLSLNVWGGLKHRELLDYLARVDADVYCLQEVTRSQDSRSAWLTYRDGDVQMQQRANLFDEIRSALPAHDGFFCPTARGQMLDGDVLCQQQFGLATLVRAGVPVIGQALDFVHGQFSAHGFGAHPRARNAHAVRVHDYRSGHAVTIVQMHGLREETGKGDSAARDAQASALAELIERFRPPGEPLIVCGDFNVLPDSRLIHRLQGLGLTDLVTTRGFTDTRTSFYTKPGRFADYMLVSSGVTVDAFDVVTTPEVSDHRPLALTFG